jgi:hypothetical protein
MKPFAIIAAASSSVRPRDPRDRPTRRLQPRRRRGRLPARPRDPADVGTDDPGGRAELVRWRKTVVKHDAFACGASGSATRRSPTTAGSASARRHPGSPTTRRHSTSGCTSAARPRRAEAAKDPGAAAQGGGLLVSRGRPDHWPELHEGQPLPARGRARRCVGERPRSTGARNASDSCRFSPTRPATWPARARFVDCSATSGAGFTAARLRSLRAASAARKTRATPAPSREATRPADDRMLVGRWVHDGRAMSGTPGTGGPAPHGREDRDPAGGRASGVSARFGRRAETLAVRIGRPGRRLEPALPRASGPLTNAMMSRDV